MQPFGIITLIVLIYSFINKKMNYVYLILGYTIFVEINKISGYFLKFNSFELGYSDFLQVTLLIALLPKLKKINRKQLNSFLFLLITCSIGALFTFIFRPNILIMDTYNSSWDELLFFKTSVKTIISINFHTVMILTRIFIWGLIGLEIKETKIDNLTDIIIGLTKLHIIFALFEFITKTIFKTNIATDFRNFFFGLGEATYSDLSTRGFGSGYSIYGFTREPSHFSEVAYLFILILILSNTYKKNIKWIMLALLLMIASTSFASVMYLISLIIIFMLTLKLRINKKNLKKFLFFFAVTLIVTLNIINNKYYSVRVNEFFTAIRGIKDGFITNNEITSSKVRLYSIYDSLNLVKVRPLFGVGIGTTSCYSGLVSILTNVGIIGFLFWVNFCFKSMNTKKLEMNYAIKTVILIFIPEIFIGELGIMYSIYIFYLYSLFYNFIKFKNREELK